MANDRIWMVCNGCGERYLIYKYYPHYGGYVWPHKQPQIDEFEEFIEKHINECYFPPEDKWRVVFEEDKPFRLENDY
jgi:hypothetical protein